jgi:voltage-gated potassium channel
MSANRPRVDTWYERLTLFRAVVTIVAIATIIVLVAGLVARIVEPDTFTSLGLAYWWALTTLTTVGYGDIVPHDTAGRLVGGVLMLTGLGLIPTITSVVVSVLVAKRSRAAREEDRRAREDQGARLARMEALLEQMRDPPE